MRLKHGWAIAVLWLAMPELTSAGEKPAAELPPAGSKQGVSLRLQDVWQDAEMRAPAPARWAWSEALLAVLERDAGQLVLHSEGIDIDQHSSGGGKSEKNVLGGAAVNLTRDPRGMLIPSADGNGFAAFTPGMWCSGERSAEGEWSVKCHASDDPWPLLKGIGRAGLSVKAIYNAARDDFAGVATPNLGVDLPPFHAMAMLERASGPALLFNGIDGKVQLVENGDFKPVRGARDWGSDLTVLQSECAAGELVIASSSSEAAGDSLRAYWLPGEEAVAASAPLAVEGAVTGLWAAADGKSVFAMVRKAEGRDEVVRVTAQCKQPSAASQGDFPGGEVGAVRTERR
jgi:hypothetical protein